MKPYDQALNDQKERAIQLAKDRRCSHCGEVITLREAQAVGAAFWNFLYCPPLMDCRAMRSCLWAASSNSYSRPFHCSHRTNLLHTTWSVSSRRTSYRMPPGFWVVRIMAYPFGLGGKITVGNGALKMETPSRPYCTQEGVWICRPPTIVPEVGLVLSIPRSIIADPK